MEMTRQDQQRIAEAIHVAETGTSGQIVCVLARVSGEYQWVPTLWAAVGALGLPWLLMLATHWTVLNLLLAQLVLFAMLWLVLSFPAVAMRLVPRSLQRQSAHRAAMEQFMLRHVSRTGHRNGIMIFVSLAEHYARIVADDAVAEKIPQSEWQAIVDGLIGYLRNGRMADGFVAAVVASGTVLHAHFPSSEQDVNELPDRLYLI